MIRPVAAPVAIDSIVTSVVRTQPASTRNMTGFLAMFRGSSIKNERPVAIFTRAGSKRLRRRVWRRCNFRVWTSVWARSGNRVGVRRVIAKIFLY